MTAADFRFIAAVIAQLPRENAVRMTTAQAFADDLRIVNPRFNERIFMDACQVTQLVMPARRIKKGDFIVGFGDATKVWVEQYPDGSDEINVVWNNETGGASVFSPSDPVRIERLNER